jgi:hypothetical protein
VTELRRLFCLLPFSRFVFDIPFWFDLSSGCGRPVFWVGWTLLGYELQKSMDMGAKNTQSCLLSVCCGCPEPVLANDRAS